jgi:hypothetical protein
VGGGVGGFVFDYEHQGAVVTHRVPAP